MCLCVLRDMHTLQCVLLSLYGYCLMALMFCIDPCLRGVSLAQQSSSRELKKECADVLESLKVCTPSCSSNVPTVKCRCNQWHSCNDVVETHCCMHSDTKGGALAPVCERGDVCTYMALDRTSSVLVIRN